MHCHCVIVTGERVNETVDTSITKIHQFFKTLLTPDKRLVRAVVYPPARNQHWASQYTRGSEALKTVCQQKNCPRIGL